MAFTAGATAQGTYGSTGNTVNITLGSTVKLLVVVLFVNGNTARTGGAPTYNGDAMTDSGEGFVVETECGVEVWYKLNPATGGDYTVSVPNTNSVNMDISAMGFIPGGGGCDVDISNSAVGTTQNPSLTLTSVAANALIVGGLGSGDRDDCTAGTNYLLIHTYDAGNQTWGSERWLDAGAAGNKTVDFGTARADDWGLIGVSFKEVLSTPQISKTDGVTIGESESVDPLVLADVSPSDGLTVGDTLVNIVVEEPVGDIDITGVTDDVAIGESITAALDDLELSVSDGLTVGESTAAALDDETIGVSDGLALGESTTATFDDEEASVSDGGYDCHRRVGQR